MSDLSRDGTYTDLQPLAVPVQVQCGELKCLAYRDREGEWRDYNTGWLLAGPIQVVEYNFE